MTEAKVKREVLSVAVPKQDALHHALINHPLPKGVRIGAWVWRFVHNCRGKPLKRSGPINTEEIQQQELFWIKQAQQSALQLANFEEDKLQLNLQYNDQKVLECRGRIMGEYPIHLPDEHPFTAKLSLMPTFPPCMEGLGSPWQRYARNTGYPAYDAW